MNKKNFVAKNYTQNTAFVPQFSARTGVDLELGMLVAYDETNNVLIKADNTDNTKRAIGIVTKSSPLGWGAEFVFDRGAKEVLLKDTVMDVYRIAVVTMPELEVTNSKIGDPVFLGKGGAMTMTKTTTNNEFIQFVGVLVNKDKKIVYLNILDAGRLKK